jgi:hypothetical protein
LACNSGGERESVSGSSWKQRRIGTSLKSRKWKIYARLVKNHQYYKQKIEIMEGINYTENGGESEEGANVRTHNKQTKYVEKVKDSTTDTQAMWLTFMEKLEDRMTQMEKRESEFEDRMTKRESEFEDRMTKMKNSIKEDVQWRGTRNVKGTNG